MGAKDERFSTEAWITKYACAAITTHKSGYETTLILQCRPQRIVQYAYQNEPQGIKMENPYILVWTYKIKQSDQL